MANCQHKNLLTFDGTEYIYALRDQWFKIVGYGKICEDCKTLVRCTREGELLKEQDDGIVTGKRQ